MKYAFIGAVALALSACSIADRGIDLATEKGAVALSQGVEGQCRRSLDSRKDAYATYVIEQKKVGKGIMLPFDCDGDGQPDF
jgi:hypothetical protein